MHKQTVYMEITNRSMRYSAANSFLPETFLLTRQCKVIISYDFRMSYPGRYELYKRVDQPSGQEKYVILSTFSEKPSTVDVNDAFEGKPR